MGNSCSPSTSDRKPVSDNSQSAKESSSTKTGKDNKVLFKDIDPNSPTNKSNISPKAKKTESVTVSETKEYIDPVQAEAIKKIQRFSRKKRAIKKATLEQQWKIFSDLDVKDEADMLHLAMFFHTLMEKVPGVDKFGSTRELNYDPNAEDAYDATIHLDNIQIEDQTAHDDIDFNNYDIGKVTVTMEVVSKIIEVCRRGGRLHFNTVVKVLRASYKIMKTFPNIRRIKIEKNQQVTVIGDLHGNVLDLIHIIDSSGLPGPNNVYIFNGDFVDRGENSAEVIAILLALLAADPTNVILNRGNHEDEAVCRIYGFQSEIVDKYNILAFEMFAEVFKHMPLATVINDTVFVVHGGLFHDKDVLISDLENIVRTDYVAKPEIDYPQSTLNLSAEEARKEYYRQLQRDLLWSDPSRNLGINLNDRGAGMTFGPDITSYFLAKNSLAMVVRSHECVYNGFQRAYHDEEITFVRDTSDVFPIELSNPPILATLFSASNYCGGDNYGAYMVILPHAFNGVNISSKTGLFYRVFRYKTTVSDMTVVEKKNKSSLSQLILRKKNALSAAFEAVDVGNTGFVSRFDWAEAMQKVTQIQVRWLAIIDILAPSSCVTPKSVNYREFLNSFNPHISGKDGGDGTNLAAMYAQRGKLEAIFNFFDLNGDGVISREEFRQGCEALNASMSPDEQKLTDFDRTLSMMDFDGSDGIDINEFLEVFRLLDARDGKVDGVISMGQH